MGPLQPIRAALTPELMFNYAYFWGFLLIHEREKKLNQTFFFFFYSVCLT